MKPDTVNHYLINSNLKMLFWDDLFIDFLMVLLLFLPQRTSFSVDFLQDNWFLSLVIVRLSTAGRRGGNPEFLELINYIADLNTKKIVFAKRG